MNVAKRLTKTKRISKQNYYSTYIIHFPFLVYAFTVARGRLCDDIARMYEHEHKLLCCLIKELLAATEVLVG